MNSNQDNDKQKESKKNWEGYSPFLRPIAYDKPSQVIKNGGVKYTKTRSLFGPQNTTGQRRIDFNPKNRQIKKTKVNDPVKARELREKELIDCYMNHGYDPRKFYKPEELVYKEAVRILEPIDLKYGIMKPKDVANRKWDDWLMIYGPFSRKSPRKVHFIDFPFELRDHKYRITIKKRLADANRKWHKKYLLKNYEKNHRRVWFQDKPFYQDIDE